MSNPFEILDVNKNWAVVWPTFNDYFTDKMKFNLLDCIFKEINCTEVGLGVTLGKDEESILWINQTIWFSDLTEEYMKYLYRFYNITGAVFHKLSEAEKFKEILEKKYSWQLLKE